MTSTPVWFGAPERPLFGVFEVPDGGVARGGVLLCQPFAVETASAKPTLGMLSRRLVEAGFAVLTFDYDGTGDSAGTDDDPRRLDAWRSSVRAAVDFVRAAGCANTAVVALRLGATVVAAELAGGLTVDAAVLWDPCPSGRTFLREQSLIRKLIGRGEILDDGSVEAPGMVFAPETVHDLQGLTLEGGKLADQVLVLTRTSRPLSEPVTRKLDGPAVEWRAVDGQELLVDVEPARVVIPHPTLDTIVAWLASTIGDDRRPVRASGGGTGQVGRTTDGLPIVERPVRLGPNRLFGIETYPEGARSSTPVLFLNAGAIDHVGPARVWVTMARSLAQLGIRSVRFDISGVGLSPMRPGASERSTRTLEGLEDVQNAQRAVSPDDPSDIAVVGLCSGGYLGSEAALSFGVRCLVMINPSFRIGAPPGAGAPTPPSVELHSGEPADASVERQTAEAPRGWLRFVPGRAVLWELVRRAPDPVWKVINKAALAHPPSETLVRLGAAGIDLLVACDDYEEWVLQRGARRTLRRLSAAGTLTVRVVEEMDHTLFCRQPREGTVQLVVGHLADRLAARPAPVPIPPARHPSPMDAR
jgi:alpha-beta hydrolase superfamily lysophospholipase